MGRKVRAGLWIAGAIALIAVLLPSAAAAQLGPAPGISPPGANDFDCKPSKGHTRPVVLVHGTFGDMTVSWNLISPELVNRGYCVFALDYGDRGTGRIEDSAAELGAFVDRVLAATGARKVAIIGHSQGGMMPRHYIKFGGGQRTVAELIGLVPSNHGTDNPLAPISVGCRACRQQVTGSDFMTRLNRGDKTPGRRIDYTQITTRFDQVVTPFTSAFLPGPKRRVTNVVLQDRCPANRTEHLGIIYNRVALQWVKRALARQGRPAPPAFQPDC